MTQDAVSPLVGVVGGSRSDFPVLEDAVAILAELGVPAELRVVSAHRTPDHLFRYAEEAAGRGIRVIVAGAGGAAHLPGMLAAKTTLPVIGVPIPTQHLGGMDSLLSIVQMPRGIPVATVAIGNATNAGLLAASILALGDEALAVTTRRLALTPDRVRPRRPLERLALRRPARDPRRPGSGLTRRRAFVPASRPSASPPRRRGRRRDRRARSSAAERVLEVIGVADLAPSGRHDEVADFDACRRGGAAVLDATDQDAVPLRAGRPSGEAAARRGSGRSRHRVAAAWPTRLDPAPRPAS